MLENYSIKNKLYILPAWRRVLNKLLKRRKK